MWQTCKRAKKIDIAIFIDDNYGGDKCKKKDSGRKEYDMRQLAPL